MINKNLKAFVLCLLFGLFDCGGESSGPPLALSVWSCLCYSGNNLGQNSGLEARGCHVDSVETGRQQEKRITAHLVGCCAPFLVCCFIDGTDVRFRNNAA